MKVYLTGSSHELQQVTVKKLIPARCDYSIGPSGRLRRSSWAGNVSGGLMVLPDDRYVSGYDVNLEKEILRECSIRKYSGVVADFERAGDYDSLLSSLSRRLSQQGKLLFVPENLGGVPGSIAIISTAISGGSLELRLQEAMDKLGADSVALDLQVVCMDFILPSQEAQGKPIDRQQLKELLRKRGAQSFYSHELCSKYFTYSENDTHHFIMYDDEFTLGSKLALAESLGIEHCFIMYSEAEKFIGRIELPECDE